MDVDRPGISGVVTLETVRLRVVRVPVVLFVMTPLFLFVIRQRFSKAGASRRERHSVYRTNLAIVGLATGLIWDFGLKAYLVIQLTAMGVAGAVGVWMFYVQHQFDGVYWQRSDEWNYTAAALHGSSFDKLPKVLQWFSGNIGFHHIHHLSARIPNYYLEDCHKADPLFRSVKPVTLSASLKSLTFVSGMNNVTSWSVSATSALFAGKGDHLTVQTVGVGGGDL